MDKGLISPKADPRWKGYMSFLAGCIVDFATGSMNAFGTFSVYFTSYYYQRYPDNPFVKNAFFIVFPVATAMEGVCFGIGTFLYFKIGIRLTHAIGGCCFVGAFLIGGFVEDPYTFGVAFSLLFGAGAGIASYPSVLAAWEFFPNSKGKVSGLIAASYGASPTLFGLLFALLANPDNVKPDKEVWDGKVKYEIFGSEVAGRVQHVSLLFALIYACQFLLSLCIQQTPAARSITDLKHSVAASASVLSHQQEGKECTNLTTAVKTWAFWNLTINMFASLIFGLFLLNVYKNYGMLQHPNDHLLSSIDSISAIVSCVGRIAVAGAMDYVSFKLAFGINMIIQLALAGTITFIVDASVWVYGVWVTLGVTAFSGIFSSFGYESTKIFGPIMGSYVFALIGQSLTAAALATIAMNEVIGGEFGYQWSFHLCAMLTLVSLALTVSLKEKY